MVYFTYFYYDNSATCKCCSDYSINLRFFIDVKDFTTSLELKAANLTDPR